MKYPGDDSEGDTPVTIPNTEVKPLCADNTCWSFAGKIGHCQDRERKPPCEKQGGFFVVCGKEEIDLTVGGSCWYTWSMTYRGSMYKKTEEVFGMIADFFGAAFPWVAVGLMVAVVCSIMGRKSE